jgi:D-alanyl-D-alanine carboxypeptidase
MLVSGNDAAAAIAVHISGSMRRLRAYESKGRIARHERYPFRQPARVHKEEHYTTAHDMAKLAAYALQNEDFRAIVSKGSYNVPATNKDKDGYQLENSNKLVHTKSDSTDNYEYRYAIGIKTGDTDAAGRCLIAAAEKDGVTLFPYNMTTRFQLPFQACRGPVRLGFANFATVDASTLGLPATVDVR